MATLTKGERFLLEWLNTDDGQLGECKGVALDALMDRRLVEWSDFARADQPRGGDFRWVRITDAGRRALDDAPSAADTASGSAAGRAEREAAPSSEQPQPSSSPRPSGEQ